MIEQSQIHPHIKEDLKDWNIYKLSKDRSSFVSEIEEFVWVSLKEKYKDKLFDVLSRTVYMERIRMNEDPWKVDPSHERGFWRKVKGKLSDISDKESDEVNSLVKIIITRYAEEIVGDFKPKTFRFARKFLKAFFNRLLNTAAGRNMKRLYGSKYRLSDKIKVYGPIDQIRELSQKGTLVVLPTHYSNLDSILIGYAIDSVVGLEAFSYGAGLNLFNSELMGYFMNRLGAYRVDRRKRNPIYLETLKTVSKKNIERGVPSLFFPGGTRARAGIIENRLKLGLLGTVIEAQRALIEEEKDEKIYLIPLCLGYHCVLEANYLIDQHLRITGKEKYFSTKDTFYSLSNISKFIWQFFSSKSEIVLSFGAPLDVFGNSIDQNGKSIDQNGNPLDVRGYFTQDSEKKVTNQREQVYTKILSEKLVTSYLKYQIIMTSHLVAYSAFKLLMKTNTDLDVFGIIRQIEDDFVFPKQSLLDFVKENKETLIKMADEGSLIVDNIIRYKSAEEVLEEGIKHLGIFHTKKPLKFNKKGEVISQSLKMLFYYHNKMASYF